MIRSFLFMKIIHYRYLISYQVIFKLKSFVSKTFPSPNVIKRDKTEIYFNLKYDRSLKMCTEVTMGIQCCAASTADSSTLCFNRRKDERWLDNRLIICHFGSHSDAVCLWGWTGVWVLGFLHRRKKSLLIERWALRLDHSEAQASLYNDWEICENGRNLAIMTNWPI